MGAGSSTKKAEPGLKVTDPRERFMANPQPKILHLRAQANHIINGNSKEKEEQLDLSRHALIELPSTLWKQADWLKTLVLSYNCLETLSPGMGNLKNLTTLRINNNHLHKPVEDLFPLNHMPQLQTLDISWNLLPTYEFLAGLTNLTHLDAHNCPSMSEPSFPDLSHLKHLRYLDLSQCQLPYLKWKSLPTSLVHLDISVNEGITSLPIPSEPFKKLNFLNVSFTKVTSESATPFLKFCSSLKILKLRQTLISEFPEDLRENLNSATILDLSICKFTEFPHWLVSLPSLETLKLSGNEISSIPDLDTSKTLKDLQLRWNKISEFPVNLLKLESLTNLDLAANDLVEISDNISDLCNLTSLNLSHNRLTKLPLSLAKLTKLNSLHIDENPFIDKELIPLYFRHPFCNLLLEHISGKPFTLIPSKRKFVSHEIPSVFFDKASTKLDHDVVIDKIYGAIFGQAIGDAIGLATEFLNIKQASFYYGAEPVKYSDFLLDGHRRRWQRADFTDDTDQMLLILEQFLSFNEKGKIDQPGYAETLLRWAYDGFIELGDSGGMGIGSTVKAVLAHPDFLNDPKSAATDVWSVGFSAAANGAVMRTAITGIYKFWQENVVIQNTLDVCQVTHVDPRCQASCIAVAIAISEMLKGEDDFSAITRKALETSLPFLEPSVYMKLSNKMTSEKAHELSAQHIIELKKYLHADIKELALGDGASIG
eukprot:TRINITY_DN2576_c0_g3_i1.p1 TRINITY_DN2576_c0_g3~~TRINITY_DN2576_c0_g3_i1.p1  ORF type:complete len:711 (-),score=90.68 TRINITY_DN2576_c0_g3_i1:365-2497(-)